MSSRECARNPNPSLEPIRREIVKFIENGKSEALKRALRGSAALMRRPKPDKGI